MQATKKISWRTSYTHKVSEKLLSAYQAGRSDIVATYNAASLLRQYWLDMHIPYEQRDAYLAEVNRLQEVVRRQTMRLNEKDDELVRLREVAVRAGLYVNPPDLVSRQQQIVNNQKQQNYMACKHYPDALANFFSHRDNCEFCCEREPLKWFDNGHHREPGK